MTTNNNKLTVTILGCGSSSGVPHIACACHVCTSPNPKNKRLRASIAVASEKTALLIDTSPDMRQQCLVNDIRRIDALLYTHAHADHLNGIDDTRSFNHIINAPLDTYLDEGTLSHIKKSFTYVFQPPKPAALPSDWGWYRPCLNPIIIKPYEAFTVGGIDILPFTQRHGGTTTLGFRFGSFAYSTDVNGFSDEAFRALEGVETWVVDCLRRGHSHTHADLPMALGWIERVKPKRAYLTHLSHDFDYDLLAKELPKGVEPAYDGLKLEIDA